MLKFALLCFVLAVGAIQASPVEYAIDAANEDFNEAKTKYTELLREEINILNDIENYLASAEKLNDWHVEYVNKSINREASSWINEVDEILANGTTRGIDVEECRQLLPRKDLEQHAGRFVLSVKNCLNNNVTEVTDKSAALKNRLHAIINKMEKVDFDAEHCIRKSSGFLKKLKVLSCNVGAKWKFFWQTITKFFSFAKDIRTFQSKLGSLLNQLSTCRTEGEVDRASHFKKPVEEISMVKSCVLEKITEYDSEQQTLKVDETVLDESKVKDSKVDDSKVEESKVADSKEEDSKVEDSKVEDSKEEDSKVEDSKVNDSKEEDSTITDSKVEDSKVEESKVNDSNVEDSKVEDSTVTDSKEEDAKVGESNIGDSNVEDSKVENSNLEAANVSLLNSIDPTTTIHHEKPCTTTHRMTYAEAVKLTT